MIADFYTKPLQGKQFYYLRDMIMGHTNMAVKERVEEKEQEAQNKKQNTKKSTAHIGAQQYKISNNFTVQWSHIT